MVYKLCRFCFPKALYMTKSDQSIAVTCYKNYLCIFQKMIIVQKNRYPIYYCYIDK